MEDRGLTTVNADQPLITQDYVIKDRDENNKIRSNTVNLIDSRNRYRLGYKLVEDPHHKGAFELIIQNDMQSIVDPNNTTALNINYLSNKELADYLNIPIQDRKNIIFSNMLRSTIKVDTVIVDKKQENEQLNALHIYAHMEMFKALAEYLKVIANNKREDLKKHNISYQEIFTLFLQQIDSLLFFNMNQNATNKEKLADMKESDLNIYLSNSEIYTTLAQLLSELQSKKTRNQYSKEALIIKTADKILQIIERTERLICEKYEIKENSLANVSPDNLRRVVKTYKKDASIYKVENNPETQDAARNYSSLNTLFIMHINNKMNEFCQSLISKLNAEKENYQPDIAKVTNENNIVAASSGIVSRIWSFFTYPFRLSIQIFMNVWRFFFGRNAKFIVQPSDRIVKINQIQQKLSDRIFVNNMIFINSGAKRDQTSEFSF